MASARKPPDEELLIARQIAQHSLTGTDLALRSGPPLGRIRDFVVDRESGRLDLKRDGTRPFVDAARIYALELGLPETATVERLRAAGAVLRWGAREVGALSEAFEFILQLRLRRQRGAWHPSQSGCTG